MKRREFVRLVGGAAAAWPLAARAQLATKIYRIGFLGPSLTNPPPIAHYRSFLAELHELGFARTRVTDEGRPGRVTASRLGGSSRSTKDV
jgi:hypothetical protein